MRPSRVALATGADGRVVVGATFEQESSARCFEWNGSGWSVKFIAEPGNSVGALDLVAGQGTELWAIYADATTHEPWIARRQGGVWVRELVDGAGRVGPWVSLALDASGRPRGAWFDLANGRLRYFSSAVELDGFETEQVWPPSGEVEVRWRGTGQVAAGWANATGEPVGAPVVGTAGIAMLPTPASLPGRVRLRLSRTVPRSEAVSDLFPALADIVLLGWQAEPAPGGGTRLSWSTWPSFPEVTGYRVERKLPGKEWVVLASSSVDTTLFDPAGVLGARYRLAARVSGGRLYPLADRVFLPSERFAVWPTVWRSGSLQLSVIAAPGDEPVRITVRDARGRRVREIHRGRLAPGSHLLRWDGGDDAGRSVPSGVYFMEWRQGSARGVERFVRLR